MAGRLTDLERADRAVTGTVLQQQIVGLAELYGWTWCHWRALQNRRGTWEVPVQGPIGKGWPDLFLARTRDRRIIFAEIKRELEQPTEAQTQVLAMLALLAGDRVTDAHRFVLAVPRIDVVVWRPSDLHDPIETSNVARMLR
jgi:hypothetical protein